MYKTVIGVFQSVGKTAEAVQALVHAGQDSASIQVLATDPTALGEINAAAAEASIPETEGILDSAKQAVKGKAKEVMSRLKGLFGDAAMLTGPDLSMTEADAAAYHQHLEKGSVLLTLRCQESFVDQAVRLMETFGAHAEPEQPKQAATSSAPTPKSAPTVQQKPSPAKTNGEVDTRIPVVREEVAIGTQRVERGGVRVFSVATRRPVEKEVTVREERTTVERRPVNRAATEADLNAPSTFEVIETAEIPVITKTPKVVEEIVIGTKTTERTQTVHATSLGTDVRVETMGGRPLDFQSLAGDFREHYQKEYGSTNLPYDDYAPAYRFGHQLAGEPQYNQQRDWGAVGSQAKAQWEESNPGTWQRFNKAIQYGWTISRGLPTAHA